MKKLLTLLAFANASASLVIAHTGATTTTLSSDVADYNQSVMYTSKKQKYRIRGGIQQWMNLELSFQASGSGFNNDPCLLYTSPSPRDAQ